MTEPRTKAGRALLDRDLCDCYVYDIDLTADVLAIEEETTELAVRTLRAMPDLIGNSYFRTDPMTGKLVELIDLDAAIRLCRQSAVDVRPMTDPQPATEAVLYPRLHGSQERPDFPPGSEYDVES